MELIAALFLAACAAAGFGITYLSGVPLNFEERVVFGAVLGAMVVTGVSFVLSSFVQDVTPVTVWVGLAIGLGAGGVGVMLARPRLTSDWADARRRWWRSPLRNPTHPWPLLAVLLVCGAWTVHFLHQAYVYTPTGLYAGYVNIWGDWAAHLTFAGSFAYGHNFPPEYPIDPGHRLGYPFMVDFFAADLVPLGLSLTEALTATSAMLGLALPGVIFLAAMRFVGGRAGAVIAVFLFLLSGGLGFVKLLTDVQAHGWAAVAAPVREYTLNRDINLQWLNPVLAYIVPQRSTLFGFSLALIVLMVLWIALREHLSWRPFLFAGLVTAVMPIFHVHAYGTVVALPFFWALVNRRRAWIGFFVPALLIGIPILVWMWPPQNTSICNDLASIHGYCIQPGWLMFTDWQRYPWVFPLDFVLFWLWNTSLLVPLMLAGHFLMRWFPTGFPRWFAPMWLWFLVPNVIVLQPWVWDNTKFFIFWALLGSIVAGAVVAGMLRRGPVLAVIGSGVLVLMCLSGFLDLYRASNFDVSAVQFTDAGGLKVADWVRRNTSPHAVFAVADEHNSPIPTLAGRRELVGYPGWLWTYGLADYVQKEADDKRILDGDPSAMELVSKYGIDYVMIGPQEIPRGASRSYWDSHGTLVYDDGEYAVYRVGRA
ncbi:MAG TPA: hypothetical protein VLK30_04760 [Candidatus Limnocylindrales bacterium]|nr:hypothetical protein [Candidatus Limnocylindrales bacterium]